MFHRDLLNIIGEYSPFEVQLFILVDNLPSSRQGPFKQYDFTDVANYMITAPHKKDDQKQCPVANKPHRVNSPEFSCDCQHHQSLIADHKHRFVIEMCSDGQIISYKPKPIRELRPTGPLCFLGFTDPVLDLIIRELDIKLLTGDIDRNIVLTTVLAVAYKHCPKIRY